MRKAGLFILLFIFSFSLFSQEINFCEKVYDFHTVRETDGVVYHDFDFMNTGENPLLIKNVLTSCGCITSGWPGEAIQPGEKAYIRLSYHPENRRETEFLGIAEVYTNAGVVNLRIFGNVIREKRELKVEYQLKAVTKEKERKVFLTEDPFERILNRIGEELLGQVDIRKNDLVVEKEIQTLRREGRWPGIDYSCYFRTHWEPLQHLKRVYRMGVSYIHPQSSFYGSDTLFVAIQESLAYWLKCKPQSHNWWFNQIAVPQQLGKILVLLDRGEKYLPESLYRGLFQEMAWPDPRKWTGANKQDIALHHLQRGCLLKNDSIVSFAVEQIFYPLQFTNREGLQADYSYQQHGNQLYIGGYGTVFVDCLLRTANWLQGTGYVLKNKQLEIFSRFLRDTYFNVYRGCYIDFSVLGRGISRKGAQQTDNMVELLKKIKKIDPEHRGEYDSLMPRFQGYPDSGRFDFSRVYWRSDYALHNRKAYDFSVRTSSKRTYKIESGNGENLYGALLSEGATSIRRQGDEYYNIFPLWNWNQVPGVTAPEIDDLTPAAWGNWGKTTFAGGVSDGKYSIMAYKMKEFGIEARKAWFMFNEEVVCLGAGIRANGRGSVRTTVEQCWDKGKVISGKNWVIHNRILYYFPEKPEFVFTEEQRTGTWNDINYNESNQKVEGSVFTLWIDHGGMAQDEKYAYVIVPDKAERSEYEASAVEIWKNDTLLQAVYQKNLDVLQLVCYGPARLDGPRVKVTVNEPCVLMVKGIKSEYPEIYVADPMQNKEEIEVTFRNAYYAVNQIVKLPQGDEKGNTIKFER